MVVFPSFLYQRQETRNAFTTHGYSFGSIPWRPDVTTLSDFSFFSRSLSVCFHFNGIIFRVLPSAGDQNLWSSRSTDRQEEEKGGKTPQCEKKVDWKKGEIPHWSRSMEVLPVVFVILRRRRGTAGKVCPLLVAVSLFLSLGCLSGHWGWAGGPAALRQADFTLHHGFDFKYNLRWWNHCDFFVCWSSPSLSLSLSLSKESINCCSFFSH